MTIKSITAVLNLDTNQFTIKTRDASSVIKQFKSDIEAADKSLSRAWSNLNLGGVAAVQKYTDALKAAQQSSSSFRNAQNSFLLGLQKEYDTLGKNASQMREYNAQQLKLTQQTAGIRAAIDAKTAALEKEAQAQRAAVDAETRAMEAEVERRAAIDEMVKSLQRQFDVLGMTREGLLAYQAAEIGATAETRALIDAIGEKTRSLELAAASERQAVEAAERWAAADRGVIDAENALRASGEALLKSLRDQVLVLKEGDDALILQEATMRGVGDEARVLTEQIAQLNGQHKLAAETTAAFAKAERDVVAGLKLYSSSTIAATGHTQSFGRAIYEVNVLMHELSSGRIRQAISSFSILLSSLGAAAGATLGLTLSIGLIYGLTKPLEEAAKHMQELNNQSHELGVSVEFLQRMGAAADLLGVKTDKLVGGIGRLDQAFARARAGSKQQKDGFGAIGVDTSQNYTNEELTKKVTDGWSKLADGPRKVTVAMELFGRSGKDLIPILDELSTHQKDLDDAIAKYGVVNPEAVAQGVALAHQFDLTKLAAQGFGNDLLVLVGPTLVSAIKGFADFTTAVGGVLKNGPLLSEALGLAKTAMVGLFTTITVLTLPSLAALGASMLTIADGAIGALIVGIFRLVAAIVTLDLSLIAIPFVGIAVGIGAAAAAVYYFAQKAHDANPIVQEHARVLAEVTKEHNFRLDLEGRLATANQAEIDQARKATEAQLAHAAAIAAVAEAQRAQADDALAKAFQQANGDIAGGKTAALGGHRAAVASDDPRVKAAQQAQIQAKQNASASEQVLSNYQSDLKTINGAKPFGSTAGDPTKTGPGKETPSERLATEIDRIKAQMSGLDTFIHTSDVVAAARAKAAADLSDPGNVRGPYAGITAGSAQGQAYINAQGDLARDTELKREDAKAVDLLSQSQSQLTKATAEYNNTLGNKKSDDFAAQIDEVYKSMIKLKPDLAQNVAFMKQYADEMARATENSKQFNAVSAAAYFKKFADDNKKDPSASNPFEKQTLSISNTLDTLSDKGAGLAADPSDPPELAAQKADARAKQQAAQDSYLQNQKEILQEQIDDTKRTRLNTVGTKTQIEDFNHSNTLSQIADARSAIPSQFNTSTEAGTAGAALAQAKLDAALEAENERHAAAMQTPLEKLSQQWADTTTQMQEHTKSWAEDFNTQIENGTLKFSTFSEMILKDWLDTMLKAEEAKVINPLFDAAGNGLGSALTNIFGGGGGGGGIPLNDGANGLTAFSENGSAAVDASGGAGGFGSVLQGAGQFFASLFHTGGDVGSTRNPRAVNPAMFIGAPRFHDGIQNLGLRSDEVPAILQKGESVYTAQQTAAMGKGGSNAPPVTVNVNNESGMAMSGDQGGTRFDGEKYVVDIILDHINKPGPVRTALKSQS